MMLMKYPSIRGENLPDYTNKANWNPLHEKIDKYIQRYIYEYPGDGLQAIKILQSQCANMTFSDKSKYNRPFKQVVHKLGEPAINNIMIFQNDKALEISVGNRYCWKVEFEDLGSPTSKGL